ncbi:MAG: ATP-dependent DNA helicase [Actinomycetaceae bacterium]|nr:ATP-dependent DNA helicase [Actinomycetaceae bacterium]
MPDPQRTRECEREQKNIDTIYHLLDTTREKYRSIQRSYEAQGSEGTPQNRSERDAMSAHYGDQAARLEQVEDRLVFGRLDSADAPPSYIGRVGLSDDKGERALIDWRAPAATPFYQATPAHPCGVIRRRHLGVHQRRVISIEDDVFDMEAAAKTGTVLQGEGALLQALNESRSAQMSDIVATIQKEQDQIIRSDCSQILVVQGGPGTGKTAVALHRAAYLLYQNHNRLAHSGLLIVGPSPVFLRYIDKVLPSLGETGVVSLTIGNLLNDITTTKNDPPDVGKIKGRIQWTSILHRVVSSFRRIPTEPIELEVGGYTLFITPDSVRSAQQRAYVSGRTHNKQRVAFVLSLLDDLCEQYLQQSKDTQMRDGSDREWIYQEIRQHRDVRVAINKLWLPADSIAVLERLYAYPHYLHSLAPELTIDECLALQRPKGSPITIEDIPLIDELRSLVGRTPDRVINTSDSQRYRHELTLAKQALSGQDLGQGVVDAHTLVERAHAHTPTRGAAYLAQRDEAWTYGHIVVDEAQELHPMAWNCLLRRCPSRSMTIVGDLAQQSDSYKQSWKDILGPASRALEQTAVLNVCYRTPAQIMTAAEEIVRRSGRPLAYPVKAVREIENCLTYEHVQASPQMWWQACCSLWKQWRDSGRSLAIISPDNMRDVLDTLARASSYSEDLATQRLSVMRAQEAKGLEYDVVCLIEPYAIVQQGPGDIFVAMTRPTQHLHVIYSDKLPDGFPVDRGKARDGDL